MTLSPLQKLIVAAGMAAVALMVLVPPWKESDTFQIGYMPLFMQPQRAFINYPQWLIPIVAAVAATIVATWLASSPKKPITKPKRGHFGEDSDEPDERITRKDR